MLFRSPTIRFRDPILVAAFLGLVCSACSLGSMTNNKPCLDNLDCALTEKCQSGVCKPYSVTRPSSMVDLELTPLSGQGLAATQVAGLDLDKVPDITEIDLEVQPEVRLAGIILSPSGIGGIPGSLVATRAADFDTRNLTWTTTVADDGLFQLDVSPGTYNLLFKPSSRDDFPQLAIAGLKVEAGNSKDPNLKYPTYPAVENLDNQVALLLLKGKVLVSKTYPHPSPNVRVEGVTDAGFRTNLAVPDADGIFYLRLPVQKDPQKDCTVEDCYLHPKTLDVTLKPYPSDFRLPTVVVPGVKLQLQTPDLGTFYIGTIPNSYTVSGAVYGPDGVTPFANCLLTFSAANIGNGTFSLQKTTSSDGQFTVNLLQGDYQVTAVPDPSCTAQMNTTEVKVDGDLKNQAIVLPPPVFLQGTVADDDNSPVPYATVWAERIGAADGADDGILRSAHALTSTDGLFGMPVDEGRYNLSVVPLPASRLPRSMPKAIRVTSTINTNQDIRLSLPAVIQGHVFDTLGQPLCGVTVDVFSSNQDRSVLIGETISSASQGGCTGGYAVVIPGVLLTPR